MPRNAAQVQIREQLLSLCLNNLESLRNQLLNLFILVLQQAKSKSNIAPLSLRLTSL